MPLLSGRVRVNSEAGAVLDLTDFGNNSRSTRSQVKGIGVFQTVGGRDLVGSDLRTQGYMAIVKNGSDNVTPYFYKKTDVSGWDNAANWTSLASLSAGLPQGGSTNDVLAKSSGTDYETSWVSSLTVEDAQLGKTGHAADVLSPTLTFSRKTSSNVLSEGESLGELNSLGYDASAVSKSGSSIRFVADGTVDAGIGSRLEFFVSTSDTDNIPQKALTVDTDKKLIFAGSSSAPTAVAGGMYYNTINNAFYLGI